MNRRKSKKGQSAHTTTLPYEGVIKRAITAVVLIALAAMLIALAAIMKPDTLQLSPGRKGLPELKMSKTPVAALNE